MPMLPEHPYDGIVADLSAWMDEEVEATVDAMRGGYRNPFTADVTEQQKHAYYTRQVFTANPDGSIDYDKPNTQGRDTLLKTLGTQQYAQVLSTVMPKKGRRPLWESAEDELAVPEGQPPMPEDDGGGMS